MLRGSNVLVLSNAFTIDKELLAFGWDETCPFSAEAASVVIFLAVLSLKAD